MLEIAVAGCAGRMGKRLVSAVAESPNSTLGAGIETPGHPAVGADAGVTAGIHPLNVPVADSIESASGCRAVIDFTLPEATEANLRYCGDNGIPIVIGTTGLSDDQKSLIEQTAQKTGVVFAPNMGVGVNLLLKVIEQVSKTVGPSYNIEVIEAHHNRKKDAPSGTALGLAEAAARGRGLNLKEAAVYGRDGRTGPRSPAEIGIHAVRGGDIIGEHTVMFAGPGEKIEISHSVITRDVFARGAVRAAEFVAGQSNGLFSMQDVLGLA